MALLPRLLAATVFLSVATGCASVFDDYTSSSSPTNVSYGVQQGRGHVYLIRGLIGEVFSRGLDTLAEKINRHGVPASVHSSYSTGALAEEVIQNYRREPGPIILIGHSTGGDAAISIAQELRKANVPVGVIFGFDPTPIAGHVPDNVELFINLFQKTNPIGGGVVKSGGGFRGRLINVDLREHGEIIHITLDKSSKIHDAVVDEIVGFVAAARMQPGAGPNATMSNSIQPYYLAYVVPPNEPIQIWDSGIQVTTRPGENLAAVAANYRVPVWLLAQVNKLDPNAPLESGKALLIPQHMYGEGGSGSGISMYAR
jgi:LysM domain-containing protein